MEKAKCKNCGGSWGSHSSSSSKCQTPESLARYDPPYTMPCVWANTRYEPEPAQSDLSGMAEVLSQREEIAAGLEAMEEDRKVRAGGARQEHTPEPWTEGARSSEIVSETPDRELDQSEIDYYGGQLIAESVEPRNRRRIVACVNACRGASTEVLERATTRHDWAEMMTDIERELAGAKADIERKDKALHVSYKYMAEMYAWSCETGVWPTVDGPSPNRFPQLAAVRAALAPSIPHA